MTTELSAALEKPKTYSMPTTCANCGLSDRIDVPYGKEFSKGVCPRCGCSTLRPNL